MGEEWSDCSAIPWKSVVGGGFGSVDVAVLCSPTEMTAPAPGSQRRVLLVEDDDILRRNYEALLSARRLTVHTVVIHMLSAPSFGSAHAPDSRPRSARDVQEADRRSSPRTTSTLRGRFSPIPISPLRTLPTGRGIARDAYDICLPRRRQTALRPDSVRLPRGE